MATKTLHNKGKRIIQCQRGDVTNYQFMPNATVEFPADQADKLRRMYRGEVSSLEDESEKFKAVPPPPPAAEPPTRTVSKEATKEADTGTPAAAQAAEAEPVPPAVEPAEDGKKPGKDKK